MNRRTFALTSAGAAAAASASAAASRKGIFELRFFKLRNTAENQSQRLSELLRNAVLPAAQRAGIGPIGAFRNTMGGGEGPFVLLLMGFPSLAGMEAAREKLEADKEYAKQLEAFHALPGLSYMRMENSLLRGFDSMPSIEVPPTEAKRPARVFEIRQYESNTMATLRRKMKMFDDGEIGIFRRVGMQPVFFGETIVGRNLPNLTYMLGYDDLAHREKTWRAFGGDPEWQKLRATPGLSDVEVVSNITNYLVSPMPFSQIR
ncbi:MAG: NIPSNAP family protein [Acidobacteria bacterium]|nr:NIPSNAP family protein [Acidobacteriota bacterium]